MESYTIRMNYQDELEIGESAFFGDDLFNFYCTILLSVLSNNELSLFDIKDLVMIINDKMQGIPIENIRP